jgi:fermentation-respiration switch protein FrsA (DUF1100 family)
MVVGVTSAGLARGAHAALISTAAGESASPTRWHCCCCRSYRGYGMSEGRPNQRGLQLDAQASLDHLLGRDDVSSSSIVVFGRSLGGAVAIHLAAENQEKVGCIVCSQRVMIGFQPAELTCTSLCSGQVSHPNNRVSASHNVLHSAYEGAES